MPRPKASSRQHSDAYDLHLAGLGSLAIWESLDKRYSDVVAPRTVDNWISGFKGLNPKIKELDSPFVFNKMEDYGLPLDASAYLLQLLTSWADGRLSWWPWVRDMRWVWRVHLAAPDLCLLDVYWLANTFALREKAHEVLGIPFDVDDLQAFLANRPWVSTAALERYREAIADGRIPPVPPPGPDDNMAFHIAEATGQPELLMGAGGEYGLLRSQFLLVQVRANMIKIYEPGAANDPTQFGALATHTDWEVTESGRRHPKAERLPAVV